MKVRGKTGHKNYQKRGTYDCKLPLSQKYLLSDLFHLFKIDICYLIISSLGLGILLF